MMNLVNRLIFSFCFMALFSQAAKAQVMTFHPDSKTEKKIKISKLNGLNVSEDCLSEKEKCQKSIEAFRKTKAALSASRTEAGNPASAYCEARSGQSEILRDNKNNEYDFCLIEKKYLIDSWDLYKMK